MFNEMQGVFFAGVALGAVIFGLVGMAYGWDYGFRAGEIEEQRRRHRAECALLDSLGEVL